VAKRPRKGTKGGVHGNNVLSDHAARWLTDLYRKWEVGLYGANEAPFDRRAELERTIGELLKSEEKAEALAWLKGGAEKECRNIAEWTTRRSVEWVRALYRRGAVEVWAVRFSGFESINTLVVTLPKDKKKRRAVLEWTNRQIEDDGFDPEEDYGQSHLYVWFD
jgi:hypothetical protein